MDVARYARLIVHRATQVRTVGDLFQIGDLIRVPRDPDMPLHAYRRAVEQRLTAIARLALTVPYRVGDYPPFRN